MSAAVPSVPVPPRRALPRRMRPLACLLPLGLALAPGCATNPVTGKSELALVSTAEEVAIGEQQYLSTRQLSGGDYVADEALVAYVREVGQALAVHSPRPLPYEFAVVSSDVPNAWALPGGKIAIHRGLLLTLEDEAQLAAVLGHEIVHAAARHGAQTMERQILAGVALGAAQIAARDLPFENAALGSAALGSELIQRRYGRDAELESDRYGMELMVKAGYEPEAAAELQELLGRLAAGQEAGWIEGLFASHPPSQERVEANRATAARLRGEAGPAADSWSRHAERYRSRLARLRGASAAYAAHDSGTRALAEGDASRALAAARQALALEPREPGFHTLESAALLALGRARQAEASASRAMALDPGHYEWPLARGMARRARGDLAGAEADLQASLVRLPTAAAHLELASLARGEGDLEAAAVHYRSVAEAGGRFGQQATDALARIELYTEPGRWLVTAPRLGEGGKLWIDLENRAPFAVRGVVVEIERPGEQGPRRDRLALPDPVPARTRVTRRTNLGPFAGPEALAAIQLRTVAAEPLPQGASPR